MKNTIKEIGGMQIGWLRGTSPFAKLTINQDKITMSTLFSGSYSFFPEQVISIEKQTLLHSLGFRTGIQIKHIIPNYPKNIMFVGSNNDKLIRDISMVGFTPKANSADIPKVNGVAFRWQTLLAVIILWNILLLTDMITKGELSLFSFIALLMVFVISILTPKSHFLQSIILKPKRNHGEIRQYLSSFSFLYGIMLIFLSIGLILEKF